MVSSSVIAAGPAIVCPASMALRSTTLLVLASPKAGSNSSRLESIAAALLVVSSDVEPADFGGRRTSASFGAHSFFNIGA